MRIPLMAQDPLVGAVIFDFAQPVGTQIVANRGAGGTSITAQNGSTSGADTNDAVFNGTGLVFDGVDDSVVVPTAKAKIVLMESNSLLSVMPTVPPSTVPKTVYQHASWAKTPTFNQYKQSRKKLINKMRGRGVVTNENTMVDCQIAEDFLTTEYINGGAITDTGRQTYWAGLISSLSGGKNTVLWDNAGNPSVMVVVPKFNSADVLTGATGVHPAFIVNGVEKDYIYVSKYQSKQVGTGSAMRCYTLRGVDPGNTITFDNSLLACRQKGTGWHLMTNAEWAAISLLCKSRGFMPRGNNNYGKDTAVAAEKAVPSFVSSNLTARTVTGTGPVAWSSDGSPFGIYDLNGNVWEWVGGLRVNSGEIQVLVDNAGAVNTVAQTAVSPSWRAILEAGTLCHTKWVTGTAYALNEVIAPGNGKTYICTTAGTSGASEPGWPESDTVSDGGAVWTYQAALTLKYDFVSTPANGGAGKINTTTQANASAFYSYNTFETEAISAGVTIPNLAKLLGIAPIDSSHEGDGLYVNTNGERLALRGGFWIYGAAAGVFGLYLGNARSYSYTNIGFRSAFIP